MDLTSRREVLRLAGAITLGLPGSTALAQGEPPGQLGCPRKVKIVVAGGHPGDPEYGCGGTIARYTDLGHEVVILYLNRGELGVPGKSYEEAGAIRFAESQKSCDILKARAVYAGQFHGRVVVDQAHFDSFHKLLAAEQPDLVFTHWPIDNHSEHSMMTSLVCEAWQRTGKKFTLYYYEVTTGEDTLQFRPTHYVDIAAVAVRKRAACFAHRSQLPDKYYALQEEIGRFRGLESGCEQAEGYVRHVQSPDFQLPLV